MEWIHYVSYFFGGAFLINALPHWVSGIMGRPFQSPFAKLASVLQQPPKRGTSDPERTARRGAVVAVFFQSA